MAKLADTPGVSANNSMITVGEWSSHAGDESPALSAKRLAQVDPDAARTSNWLVEGYPTISPLGR
jgi:hypothetical protein